MSLNFKAAWGIELGMSSVSAVKIQKNKGEAAIVDHYVVPFDSPVEEEEEFHEKAVSGLMRLMVEANIKKSDPVITAIPGRSVFARAVELPPMDPKRIPELIKYEASQQIPFPIEEVVWDYHMADSTEEFEEIHATIFAVRREEIDELLSIFREAGLRVQGIQTTPLAMLNFVRADVAPKQPSVLIDVKASNIDFIIHNEDDFWQRNIQRGGNDINKALMTKFKIPFAQAEELKRSMGTSNQAQKILQVVQPVFKNMSNEIQRSIGHYKSQHSDVNLTVAYLLGNTLRMTKLVEFFQANLRLKIGAVSKLNNLAGSTDNLEAVNKQLPSLTVAIGLALQGVGLSSVGLNLLPTEIVEGRAKARKLPWFAAASLFSGLAGFTYFSALTEAKDALDKVKNNPSGDIARIQGIANEIVESEEKIAPKLKELSKWRQLLRDPDTFYPRDHLALLLSELNSTLKKDTTEDTELVFIEKIETTKVLADASLGLEGITAVAGLPELNKGGNRVIKVTLTGSFYTREGGSTANINHMQDRVVKPLNEKKAIFKKWAFTNLQPTKSEDGADMQRFEVSGYFLPEAYRKMNGS